MICFPIRVDHVVLFLNNSVYRNDKGLILYAYFSSKSTQEVLKH